MSDLAAEEIDGVGNDEIPSFEAENLQDYITGEPVKNTPREQVRQHIARSLVHTYGISVEDMAPDFGFMAAVAEDVGLDRRGNTLYKRRPDGEERVEDVEYRERIRTRDQSVLRVLQREVKSLDDGLPPIANTFLAFRAKNKELDA